MLAVIANGQTNLPVASRIGSEFVRHHDTRHTTLLLKQLADQSFGGFGIPVALYQDVQYKTILIDGAPEPCFLPLIETTASSRCHMWTAPSLQGDVFGF